MYRKNPYNDKITTIVEENRIFHKKPFGRPKKTSKYRYSTLANEPFKYYENPPKIKVNLRNFEK